ncbi:hypothetical protein Tco_0196400, partial [Tanacetum coccineum]
DYEILFQPLFDEYFNPPPCAVSLNPVAVATPRPVDPADAPSSTTIDQDVPSASTSPINQEIQSQVTHQGVEEQIHGQQNAQFDNAPRLTKNHPLEDVIGDPSRPVSTRSQLQEHRSQNDVTSEEIKSLQAQLADAKASSRRLTDELSQIDGKLSDQALVVRNLQNELVLESDEFYAALARVASLGIASSVERGLRMGRTDAEFKMVAQNVSNFSIGAEAEFNKALSALSSTPFPFLGKVAAAAGGALSEVTHILLDKIFCLVTPISIVPLVVSEALDQALVDRCRNQESLTLHDQTLDESNDLTSLSLDELIGNLKVHEMIIKKDSEIVKEKVERKSIALRDSGEEDDEKVKDETCLVAHAIKICLGVDLEPDEWIKDSGCFKHMTGNRKLFSTYKAYNGGNVIFGSNLRDNIIGKGKICDNKCRVTFSEHDSEITKDGKVIGRGIRKKGLYVMKLGNKQIDQICLQTIDENSLVA